MNMKGKALLAGCIALIMSGAAMAEDIKVAVVGAMSGPVAQYGDQEFTGAEQAIADINAKGGIKGNKLQMVKYDDACDPKQAVAVANKVINDGIKYVIGHLCSSSTQPASDIYEDEGVLMITPAATAPELTARGYHLILRTTGLDSDQGPTAAKYILEKVKPQRIAIVHDKQQYGEGLARAVQDNLKKGGANVVFFDGITAGEKRTCRCLTSRALLRKVCWSPSRRTTTRFRRTNRLWMRSKRRNRIQAARSCGPPMPRCSRCKQA